MAELTASISLGANLVDATRVPPYCALSWAVCLCGCLSAMSDVSIADRVVFQCFDCLRGVTIGQVLFAKLEEHLNSLATMKLSPYFRAVQEFQASNTLFGRLTTSVDWATWAEIGGS